MKCKAAVFVRADAPLEIREFEVPNPGPGEAIIEMKMAGICDVDARRWHDPRAPVPMIFGHENIGRIYRLGSGRRVDAVGQVIGEGDYVVFGGVIPCGQCFICTVACEPTSCESGIKYGGSTITGPPYLRGGYAEYVHLVSLSGVVKLRNGNTLEKPFLAIAGHKGVAAGIERMGGISPEETVVIQGTLPQSLIAVTQAKMHGARRVIIVGPSRKRLEVALDLGADASVDMSAETTRTPQQRVSLVLAMTDGHGADIIIDTSGMPEAIDEGLSMARPGGRYLVMGQATDYGTTPIHTTPIMKKQLKIFGSYSGLPRHLFRAIEELEKLDIPLERLITHRFRLENATEGLGVVDRTESVLAVLEYP